MHLVDWFIVAAYLIWVVYDGLKRTKTSSAVEGYFLANRSLPWWAVGLTVMATQMSAITLVGTTGQGYADGMRFVQFYFGLPVAMIILSLTLVPFFYRAKVYTAYEYLERRFDVRTRTLASLLFLMSRGLQAGVIIAAPAVILSIVLGFNLTLTIIAIGLPTTLYTMFGGVQAVTWTDVKQMVVIVAGLAAVVFALVLGLPEDVGLGEALHIAGATGRLTTIDFQFDLNETYTFWSGLIGGLFLMLGYFGCDQSQVQRYLTAESVNAGRRSLLMSAFVKIPLQALILLTGVLVFTFYLFQAPPMLFNPVHEAEMQASSRAAEWTALDTEFQNVLDVRRAAVRDAVTARRTGNPAATRVAQAAFVEHQRSLTTIRGRAVSLVKEVTDDASYNDVNYVFPTFVTTELPIGLVGLIVAAIFAAAMSSIAAELNSLSTATVIDMYRRHIRTDASDQHYLRVSKTVTGFWGLFASLVAVYAANLGSLIEVVNRFGSFFYGSLLGVFILAVGTRRATSLGAVWGLVGGMVTVTYVAVTSSISFLWLNVVGATAVFVVGMAISTLFPAHERTVA
ncbi:MAG: sodium:solute symporter [Vicinamibacterales bacterium]|jgi:SSS family transporter|nr:sodium:solute symporter [Acidobacteriota bacterium]MDP7210823.1 sodium:solute symporter [Vicinamibacterales bacterium]HJO17051.1 sodium:solute symporter [Vicinamibacterales bacterium]|tara:strand:+ start:11517 stop:13217 length:1701 start_codon:yes stop_codon:yes gene_type:complete